MGDKEASFAGSRSWIGSFEVGYCVGYMSRVQPQRRAGAEVAGGSENGELEHTAELACRSVHLGGAAELADPSNARLLLAHFERIGTPVMIGAHRIAAPLRCCDSMIQFFQIYVLHILVLRICSRTFILFYSRGV